MSLMSSSVGVRMANVPWMATALKRCIVIDSLWKRNAHSRESSDSCEMRLPSSFRNWNPAMFNGPKVSMAIIIIIIIIVTSTTTITKTISCRETGSECLAALTGFVNCLLTGEIHPEVSPILFWGNSIALEKKTGGVRPIAVGYTLRRMC